MIAARLAWEEEAAPIRRQLDLRKREPNDSEREVLARRPDSDVAVEIAFKAWREVTTERQIGMIVGPIPASAIDRLCDRWGLDRDANEVLKAALLFVDDKLMAKAHAKAKNPS